MGPRRLPPLLRRARALGTIACCGVLGGCYVFTASASGALAPGARVRVPLTTEGAAALAPTIGASVTGVEGSLVRTSGDTLVVRADRLLTTADVDVAWTGAELTIPASWHQGVQRRALAKGRTALLLAGGAAVATAVIVVVRRAGDAEGGSPGGDPIRVDRRPRP